MRSTVETDPDIPRWQYRVVSIGSFFAGDRLGVAPSYFGQTGWELVNVYDKSANWLQGFEKGFILFKRPVPAGHEPFGAWTEVWSTDQVVEAYEQLAEQ